jgi:hypothetical protein
LLGVAVLLAAATAAPDTVITVREVIPCSVVAVDTNFVRLRLPQGGIRVFDTHDVLELRLSDPSRFPDLATQLPRVEVVPASALPPQPSPASDSSLLYRPGVMDTLPRRASPAAMAAKCREMEAVLRGCGLTNDTVFELFHEVDREQAALRSIWPQVAVHSLFVPTAGLLGWSIGTLFSFVFSSNPCEPSPVGPTVGCIAGSLAGAALGTWRSMDLIARHRDRVNHLVRRVNLAVAEAP